MPAPWSAFEVPTEDSQSAPTIPALCQKIPKNLSSWQLVTDECLAAWEM